MALLAGSLRALQTAPDVFLPGDRLKVIGPTAAPDATQMIEFKTGRNQLDEKLINSSMHQLSALNSITLIIQRSIPKPALRFASHFDTKKKLRGFSGTGRWELLSDCHTRTTLVERHTT